MNIEILGIHPYNKGALLMLAAVRAQVSDAFPDARFAVPLNWPADLRLEQGLWCTFPRTFGPTDVAAVGNLIPTKLRQGLGYIAPADVDVILDASGFGYGDYWGLQKLRRRMPFRGDSLRKKNKKLILLPQALGPFEKPGMADAFKGLTTAADLVYVRDRKSMQYVEAICAPSDKIRRSPDFTNLLAPALPERLDHVRNRSLIIPNRRVAGDDALLNARYLEFLRIAIEMLQADGQNVSFLVHEGEGDFDIARDLNTLLDIPIDVIDEPSPLVTKAIISQAHLTVTSRFHGLVSALSSAVPSLSCGWSHKYGELMADYDCGEKQIDLTTSEDIWQQKVADLCISAKSSEYRNRLKALSVTQKSLSRTMWDDVFSVMRGQPPRPA